MGTKPTTTWRSWLVVALPVAFAVLVMACGANSGPESVDNAAAVDISPVESSTTSTVNSSIETTAPADVEASEPESVETIDEAITPVVYDKDFSQSIQPIFVEGCGSCHVAGGPGASHWELGTARELADDHRILSQVVASGYMPPWPAGGDSPAFKYDRSLRDDQVQAILDWSADGGALDVADNTPLEPTVEVVGLANPDLVVAAPAAYGGSPAAVDDYRCQVYDPELENGGWITSYEFIPDQKEVVHHAIGYLLPASARERAEERDGEDGKPGWSCFGSSGLGANDIFLGWAPGQDPSAFPEGTGLRVEPGEFIVVQIHYHYDGDAPEDASTLALELAENDALINGQPIEPIEVSQYVAPAEIPCSTDEQGPLCDREAALTAAVERYGAEGVLADQLLRLCGSTPEDYAAMTDGIASASCDIPVGLIGSTGEIVSVLGHEHELGSWFKMTLNPGRSDEKVLLDIPVWDFDWQYNYEPEERIVLQATDVVRMECGWDRSLRDPNLEPSYVLWADGTNDEMCFGTIATRPAP